MGVSKEPEKTKEVPAEFREIDFENFSYPTSWRAEKVSLKNGEYEYSDRKDQSHDSFSLQRVDYADLTGDGKQEAIVQVSHVSCGVSCDGGASQIYCYSIRRKKPTLLWRIVTGSVAYDCGLKTLVVNGSKLTLEVFRKCHFGGGAVVSDEPGNAAKFNAKEFTRFILVFNGRRFALRKREVLAFSGESLSYHPDIRISDDE